MLHMDKTDLRDSKGFRIGWIETEQHGVQVGRGAVGTMGQRLGTYDPKTNVTRDAKGARVGMGNQLASLICMADTRKK